MAAIAAVLPHMTKNQEFIIQQRCEDMIRYGYVALRRFPKSERHVLSAEIRHTMLDLLALVIRVKKRFFKKTSLQDLDICIDTLRSQIRLAMEMQFLPFKQYEVWSKQVDEIGRMAGAMIKGGNTSRA
jgi:hypothetical protein